MTMNLIFNRLHNPTHFDPSTSIPPLTDQVIIVTGGNAGIGLESVRQLSLHHPSKLYLACRNKTKFDAAIEKLQNFKVPDDALSTIHFLQLDLNDFASVQSAASTILSENDRLDILMCNAGIMGAPPGQTAQGYESHFGVNFMGHALMTHLLLPLLQRTANATAPPSDTKQPKTNTVRIINVSSMAYFQAKGVPFDQVKTDMASSHSFNAYAISKLAQIQYSTQLNARYPDVLSVALHPGRVATGLLDDFMEKKSSDSRAVIQRWYDRLVGPYTVEEGAWCQLWASTSPDVEKKAGFYAPVSKRMDGNSYARDKEAGKRLWDFVMAEFKAQGVEVK